MRTQLKKLLRVSPFVLTLSILIATAGSSLAYAVPSPEEIHVTPNGNDQYRQLCADLKKISDGKLYADNCHNDTSQTSQDKAAKNICDTGTGKTKLKSQCDAYSTAKAAASPGGGGYSLGVSHAKYSCGAEDQKIDTAIDFGCSHKGPAMLDLAFAVIRFLSNGAGLIIIASLVWGGLQYTLSRGDPQSTAMAVTRLRSVLLALMIYIFAYAILNYLIPGVVLR